MTVKREVYRVLDTNGDGTGTKNAVGNYSSTPTVFYIQDTTKTFYVNRMLIQLEDAGAFATNDYGAGTGLTNGISINIYDSTGAVLNDLTDGIPIKSNNDWARVCYDLKLENWATGNGAIHARWTFANAGHPIILKQGDRLGLTLNDNFTGLVSQYFKVQGWSGVGV
jgi:hypothetical protein